MSTHTSSMLSTEELQRYQRQIILNAIGVEGQLELKNAKVLCIGAGGLGSPSLIYLAASGVGTLGIIDMDKVELTNLHRQILYSEEDAGKEKVVAAAEHLQKINQFLKIKTYPTAFSPDNAEEIMREYDLVIDGTDNFMTKYLINDCAVKCGIPYVYGSILGFEGRVSVFWGKQGPCYRCMYPAPPKGYIPNCAEFGIVGALAGTIGCIQAMEAIKWLAGKWKNPTNNPSTLIPLLGTLWILDSSTMQVQSFKIKKNPHCSVCSKDSEKISFDQMQPLCANVNSKIKEITAQEWTLFPNKSNVIILDVRDLDEWKTGHLPSAQHMPVASLISNENALKSLDPEKHYLVYCQTGMRSQTAASYLLQKGFRNVMNLSGGLMLWKDEIVV